MPNSDNITKVVGQLFWCFAPAQFSEPKSSRSWQYFSASKGSISFSLPEMRDDPLSLRLMLAPEPLNLKLSQVTHFDRNNRAVYCWTPELDSFLASSNPSTTAIYSASASGKLRAVDSEDGAWHIKVPASLASSLRQGGSLKLDFTFSECQDQHAGYESRLELPFGDSNFERSRLGVLSRRLVEAEHEAAILRRTVEKFYTCNSWRVAAPLRHLASLMRSYGISQKRFGKALQPAAKQARDKSVKHKRIIDVIVPVYLGLDDLKNCLDSVFDSRCQTNFELILINDCTPDAAISKYLREFAHTHDQAILLENEKNLGFTGTVVRAMALHPDRDVVLLNSDTIVSHNWLDRLINHAYSSRKISSVTPFSNNASICGYPKFLGYEELPEGWTPAMIDAQARAANSGLSVKIPTAVGFCMFIRRDSLREAGSFDAESFPGYGEENDFSVRASQKGWTHLLAADTFVYHKGAVSFKESSEKLKLAALSKLRRLYPTYDPDVQRFILQDPPKFLRQRIDLNRILAATKPAVLAIMHNGTGGTERHLKELVETFDDRLTWLVLKGNEHGASLQWTNVGEGYERYYEWRTDYGALLDFLKGCRIARAHVHHTHTFTSRCRKLLKDLGVAFDFTIHDFATACPRVQFVDYTGKFCGQPDEKECNRCLTYLPTEQAPDIETWRSNHSWLLNEAQRIFCPSTDAGKRIKQYYPNVDIICTPHLDHEQVALLQYCVQAPLLRIDERLRIAVLGALNEAKGADILEACAVDAIDRDLQLEFHLLGHAYRGLQSKPKSALLTYGQYLDKDLQQLISQVKPHLVWFPAVWPETYCYTLSACLKAALPIVAPDLGAFTERLSGRVLTWLVPWDQTPESHNNFFDTTVRAALEVSAGENIHAPMPHQLVQDYDYQESYLNWLKQPNNSEKILV